MEENDNTYIEMEPPPDLKGRPIIAGPNSPTNHLGELLKKIISPLVPNFKSYIKDDWDFLRNLPNNIPYPCNLYSCDIKSLYTNISHDLGLKALNFEKHKTDIDTCFTKEFILQSAKFVLNNNNFFFDTVLYKQLIGTAMGTDFAPSYANIAVGYLEEHFLYPNISNNFDKNISELIIDSYSRYMDDGFLAWPNEENIHIFNQSINSLDPNLEFMFEPSIKYVDDNGTTLEKLNFSTSW